MISVIIPAYNAQVYLRECLESVLAQTFTDWECLIVDDGSTDSTLAIAREYADTDSRVRVLTKHNGGLADARNFGLQRVNGEWVTFVDSDDMLYPTALSRLHNMAGRDCEVVVGEYLRACEYTLPKPKENQFKCLSGIETTKRGLFQTGVNVSACGKLFRHETISDISFRKGVWYEDLDFFARLFPRLGKVVKISDVVYFYRDNPDSFVNTFSPQRFDVLKVTEDIERMMAESYPELLTAARDRRLSANFNMFGLLSVHDKDRLSAEVQEQCWQLIKSYRLDSLRNPDVRLKNKLGILVSYMGRRALSALSRIVYHS